MAGQTYYPAQQGQQGYGAGQPPMPPPPRPPRKSPYHDGQSKSEQYYDLYSMIRNPNAPKNHRPPDPPPRRDEQLSKQKRLEMSIQKKFEENNYQMPGNRFAGIGKFFKILFLALVLPPYMILYGFPRWIFTVAIPGLIRKINQAINAFVNRIKQAIRRFVASLIAPFKKLWQRIRALKGIKGSKMIQTNLDDEHLDFLSFLAKGIIIFYNTVIRPPVHFSIWSYKTVIKIVKAIRALPQQTHEYIQAKISLCQKIVKKLARWIINKKNLLQESLRKRFVISCRNWYQPKRAAVLRAIQHVINHVKTTAKRIYVFFKEFVLNPVETAKKTREAIQKQMREAVQRIKRWYTLQVNKIRTCINQFWAAVDRKVFQPVRDFRAKWIGKVMAVVNRGVQLYRQALTFFTRAPKQSTQGIPNVLSRWMPNVFARLRRAYTTMKTVYLVALQRMKGATIALKQAINHRLHNVVNRGQKLLKAFSLATAWVKRQSSLVLNPILDPFRAFGRMVSKLSEKLAMRVRLIKAWATVLLRHGMRLVSHAANELVPWFRG